MMAEKVCVWGGGVNRDFLKSGCFYFFLKCHGPHLRTHTRVFQSRVRYRYYTETRGDIFMPRGEAEGQKYINPSFCVIPDIHTTGKVFSYFTVHSSEYSN